MLVAKSIKFGLRILLNLLGKVGENGGEKVYRYKKIYFFPPKHRLGLWYKLL
jgi:hypothetical protein